MKAILQGQRLGPPYRQTMHRQVSAFKKLGKTKTRRLLFNVSVNLLQINGQRIKNAECCRIRRVVDKKKWQKIGSDSLILYTVWEVRSWDISKRFVRAFRSLFQFLFRRAVKDCNKIPTIMKISLYKKKKREEEGLWGARWWGDF